MDLVETVYRESTTAVHNGDAEPRTVDCPP